MDELGAVFAIDPDGSVEGARGRPLDVGVVLEGLGVIGQREVGLLEIGEQVREWQIGLELGRTPRSDHETEDERQRPAAPIEERLGVERQFSEQCSLDRGPWGAGEEDDGAVLPAVVGPRLERRAERLH